MNKLENDFLTYYKYSIGDGKGNFGVGRVYWTFTTGEKNPFMIWTIKIRSNLDQKINGIPVRKSFRGANVRCAKDADKK